jgi:hypothetical protein
LTRGRDHALYVTLEPCFLCAAAITMSHVGSVWFAGSDPMWRFLEDLSAVHPELTRRDYARQGPIRGPFGAWGTLLPLIERLMRDPAGTRVEAYEAAAPDLVEFARELVSSGRMNELVQMPPELAVSAVWPELVRLGDQVP